MMKNDLSSGSLWNQAGQAGLVLGAATIAFTFVGGLCGGVSGFGGRLLSTLVTLAKLATCVWILRRFLLKLKEDFPDAGYKALHGYGMRTTLCSSLLVAAYALVPFLIDGDETARLARASAEEAFSQFGMALDANTQAALETTLNNLPVISFFSMFLYCLLWGWVLTSAFSRQICPPDPFAGPDGDNLPN